MNICRRRNTQAAFGIEPLHTCVACALTARGTRLRLVTVVSFYVCTLCLALTPPPVVISPIAPQLGALARSWYFFCSLLVGAAPFLIGGALVSAIAERSARHCQRSPVQWPALVLFSMFLPACDCCMNGAAAALRAAPRAAAAFALTWGACCNPLALMNTSLVLGWRMVVYRMLFGLAVSVLTAAAWSRLADSRTDAPCDHADLSTSFIQSAGGALSSFSVAAAFSALALVYLPRTALGNSPLLAAAAGSVLSPCSSADAVLASAMFRSAHAQLAFIVASQCGDLRQLAMVWRWFGPSHAWSAAVSAALGIALGQAVFFR